MSKLSETADVFFTTMRADTTVFRSEVYRLSRSDTPVYAYVILKYILLWKLYRTTLRELVNPRKDHKLNKVALRHNIDVM
jgi:hypothetical protein